MMPTIPRPPTPTGRRPALPPDTERTTVWARRWGDLDRRDALTVAALAALYLAIEFVWLLRAIPFSDQLHYFKVAADADLTTDNHRDLRIGLILPVRLMIQVFDYSEAAYYAIPVATGLLFLGTTYLFGALLHSRQAGTMAAAAAAFNGHVIADGSYLLPDLLGAALFTLSLTVLGASTRRPTERLDPALIVAGLLLGWSYLVREFLVLFFPLVLVVAASARRTRFRDLAQVAAGALVMLALEIVHNAMVLGRPLARVDSILRKAPAGGNAAPGTGAGPEAEQTLIETALILPRQLLDRSGGMLLLGMAVLAVLATVAAALSRRTTIRNRLLVPVTWMAVIYLLMTFFGWTTTDDGAAVIRIKLTRYWYPILPAMAVGGAIALLLPFDTGWLRDRTSALTSRRLGHAVLALVVLAALVPHARLPWRDLSGSFVSAGGGSEFREFRDWIADAGNEVDHVYVDSGHWRSLDLLLPIYTRTTFGRSVWDGEVRPIDVQAPLPPTAIDGPVVVHVESTDRMVQQGFLLPHLADPPAEWRPLLVADNGRLAVLGTGGADPVPGRRLALDGGTPSSGVPGSLTPAATGSWDVALPTDAEAALRFDVRDSATGATTVSVSLEDDLRGSGELEVVCEFPFEGREPAFTISPPPDDPAGTVHHCQGTDLTAVHLRLTGQLEGRLTTVDVRAYPTEE